ncbi:hypothetical protein ACU4GD_23900 [Cupriavidus basilensis]
MQATHEDHQMAFEALDSKLSSARHQLRDFERAAQEALFAERNLANRIEELQPQYPDRRRPVGAPCPVAGRRARRTGNHQRADRAHRTAGRAGAPRREGRKSSAWPAPSSTRCRRNCASTTTSAWPPNAALQPLRDRITELPAQGTGRAPEPGAVQRTTDHCRGGRDRAGREA